MATADLLIKIKSDTAAAESSLKKIDGKMGAFKKSLGTVGAAMAGAFAGQKIISAFSSAIGRAEAMATAYDTTTNIIKQTGGAANVTGDQVKDMAKELSAAAGIDKEIVTKGANIILTFKNIKNAAGEGNDVFDRTVELAADMAAVFGGDLTSQATLLGKALNDPITGLSALTRVGVTFTDEQKKMIRSLQESGDLFGAQKIILNEIEGQVGGTAKATANATDKMAVAWQEVQEALGTALLPVIGNIADAFIDLAPVLAEVATEVGEIVSAALELVVPLLDLSKMVRETKDRMNEAEESGGFFENKLKDLRNRLGEFLNPASAVVDKLKEITEGNKEAEEKQRIFIKSLEDFTDPAEDMRDHLFEVEQSIGDVIDKVEEADQPLVDFGAVFEETARLQGEKMREMKQAVQESVDGMVDIFEGAPEKIELSVDELIANVLEIETRAAEFKTAMQVFLNAGLDHVAQAFIDKGPAAVDQALALGEDLTTAVDLEMDLAGIANEDLLATVSRILNARDPAAAAALGLGEGVTDAYNPDVAGKSERDVSAGLKAYADKVTDFHRTNASLGITATDAFNPNVAGKAKADALAGAINANNQQGNFRAAFSNLRAAAISGFGTITIPAPVIGTTVRASGTGTFVPTRGLNFQEGGIVPGPRGLPQLATVHAGETILPTHNPDFVAAMRQAADQNQGGPITIVVKIGEDELGRVIAPAIRRRFLELDLDNASFGLRT